jgi:hypothetical protein
MLHAYLHALFYISLLQALANHSLHVQAYEWKVSAAFMIMMMVTMMMRFREVEEG